MSSPVATYQLFVKGEYYGECEASAYEAFGQGSWKRLLSEHFYCGTCGVVWLDFVRSGPGHFYRSETCPDCRTGTGRFRGGWFWPLTFYSYQLPYRALEEEFLRLTEEKSCQT
jgi:hypothetical protein